MNIVDIHKDSSRHNATEEPPLSVRPLQPPHKPTTADAGLPVPAPLVAHTSSSDNMRGALIPRSPGPKRPLGMPHHSSLNFSQLAPTPLHTGITPATESEYNTTDDEYHVLNKDDIVSEFNQKPSGWPKQASNVRWISVDQKPTLVTSGLVTTPPIVASPKSSTQIQPSPFARFLSRPTKEPKQLPIDLEPQIVLASKPQTALKQTKDQIPELEDKTKRLKNDAKLHTVLGQSGGPVAVLGLGGSM